MKRYLFFFFVLLLASCSLQNIQVYTYQPVIEIKADTTEMLFNVPDLEPDGWWNGDGVCTIEREIEFKETAGLDAYITDINWMIISNANNVVVSKTIKMAEPMTIRSESFTMDLEVILSENDAIELDEADDHQDNVGTGSLIIHATFYDERAETYSSVPLYISIRVLKP